MAGEVYSSPEALRSYTGIEPGDLDLVLLDGETEEQALMRTLREWLEQVKDLIDTDRNRDYHKEVVDKERVKVPPGIHNIALRAGANMVAFARVRRNTDIIEREDMLPAVVRDRIFTSDIKADLSMYPKKVAASGLGRIGFFKVRNRREMGELGL